VADGDQAARGSGESQQERTNRELIELLNELRVALPGVQVLFAFLLAVPFQQRFKTVSSFERDVYYATLLCALISTAVLIAPTALHRLNFRNVKKDLIVEQSNTLAIAGLAVLAVAMTGVVLLISSVLFGTTVAVAGTAFVALLFLVLWAGLPLRERRVAAREGRRG
jgi:hypothetical protein